MPNPGSFTGSRGEFLKEQCERYAQAVKDGNINDVVTDIQRRYFKRYPITLAHDTEPSKEWLDQVNDDAADPEIEPPNVEGMSPVDAAKALQDHTDLMKKLKDCKDSIRRRLQYMYSKENDPRPSAKSAMATDIVSALTAKILSVDAKLPRQKTAYNVWGPQHREIVDPVFNKRVEDGNIPTNQQIALRSAIYKELFDQLPEDERDLWAKAAIREHEKAVREIKKSLQKGVSTTPQDRQRVIAALPSILEPIFDLLADHTGWRFSGIAGGPEPADGGRLNMIMIHSGVIPGTVKADFGRDQHEAFKKSITPSFGSYLKKCFSIKECRARALPQGFEIRSLADVDAEGPLDLYTFEIDKEHVEASKSHKAKRLFEKETKARKFKKQETPQHGTPSPPVRFGPPIGKTKLRELPSKDKPKRPSTLISQPAPSSPSKKATDDVFSQGFVIEDLGKLPDKLVLTADDSSSLYGAAAVALQCYVSTSSRINPSTPAPSRDPESHEGPVGQASRARQNSIASPIAAPTSLPPSPAVSCPASPPATLDHGISALTAPSPPAISPSSPATPPVHPATPPVHPATPPVHPATLPVHPATPPFHPKTPPVRPATPSSCPEMPLSCSAAPPSGHNVPRDLSAAPDHPSNSPSPVSNKTAHSGSSKSTAAPRLATPSGAATVPELPPVDADFTNKRRDTRMPSGGLAKRRALTPTRDMPKKKPRTAVRTPFEPAFPLDLPSDHPPWVQAALELLTREDLGAPWRNLVAAWLYFEESSGFMEEGGRLGSQGRPECVAQWIKRKRSGCFEPNLGNLDVYEDTFVGWWNSIQPSWRNAGEDAEVGGGRSGDDWTSLMGCYGLNGILSAIAALFFWGSAAAAEGKLSGWSTAVADAHYVLQQLA